MSSVKKIYYYKNNQYNNKIKKRRGRSWLWKGSRIKINHLIYASSNTCYIIIRNYHIQISFIGQHVKISRTIIIRGEKPDYIRAPDRAQLYSAKTRGDRTCTELASFCAILFKMYKLRKGVNPSFIIIVFYKNTKIASHILDGKIKWHYNGIRIRIRDGILEINRVISFDCIGINS